MTVVIVGGGLIGLGIAWRLAQSGVQVTVVDAAAAQAASRVAAGLLVPAGGRISRAHLALRLASQELYPSFVDELEQESGVSCGYHPCGTLTVAYEPGAVDSVEGLANCLSGLGVPVRKLSGRECLELEPALSDEVAAGFFADDHQVDPERLMNALITACRVKGVTMVEGRVRKLLPESAHLEDGTVLHGERIVVAAGAWIGALLSLPVYPVKGEVIRLFNPSEILRHNLIVRREELYVANRGDGRYVVGTTEELAGFDEAVTATGQLKEKVDRLLPRFRSLSVLETRVGFRPKVGDGLPLLGGHDGFVVAGGHYRNGVLLTPVTSQLISDYILSARVPDLMKPFLPDRDTRHRDERDGLP